MWRNHKDNKFSSLIIHSTFMGYDDVINIEIDQWKENVWEVSISGLGFLSNIFMVEGTLKEAQEKALKDLHEMIATINNRLNRIETQLEQIRSAME